MFSTFSLGSKAFDLDTALAEWPNTNPAYAIPTFTGKSKRKNVPTIDAWLGLVEVGCTARKVPRAHWPAVAKHFMSDKAGKRVLEVEKVMRALHGEAWVWSWKAFRVAVLNMGWEVDAQKTKEVRVERKSTGLWSLVTEGASRIGDSVSTSKDAMNHKNKGNPTVAPTDAFARPTTASRFRSAPAVPTTKTPIARPAPQRRGFSLPALPLLRTTPAREPSLLTTITAQVPVWLLAATDALAKLSEEHPDVLTAIATALVAVGTVGVSASGAVAVAAIGEAVGAVGRAVRANRGLGQRS